VSDFLDKIAIRALGGARGIRPRTLPMFAEPDLSGSRDLDTALEVFDALGDTSHSQVIPNFATSTDREQSERNPGRSQSHRPEMAEPNGLETRHHLLPERPASRDRIERTVPRDDFKGVHGSAPQVAHGEAGDTTAQTVHQSEPQRSNSGADLFSLERTLPHRDVEMSSHAIAEQPAATAQREASPAFAASRHSVKPAPPRAAEARVQSPAPSADPATPVSEQFDFMPNRADERTSSPANAALQASELPPAFMESESNSSMPQPRRRALSPMIGASRTRNLQRLRQATGQGSNPAEPDIHITIGRVDVRAIIASPAQEKKDRSSSPLQLADYLKRRDGSGAA
jgi:hypothetical protein